MRAFCLAVLCLALLYGPANATDQGTLDITLEALCMKMIGTPSEEMGG